MGISNPCLGGKGRAHPHKRVASAGSPASIFLPKKCRSSCKTRQVQDTCLDSRDPRISSSCWGSAC